MNISVIIAAIIELFLQFTVYGPIEGALQGIVLDVAEKGAMPFWFPLTLQIAFFAGTFTPIYIFLQKVSGD